MKHLVCILISCGIFISSYSQPKQLELSHYLFPEFTNGIILMKTGIEQSALLNYNSLTEEMIFENNGQKLAIAKNDLNLIDTVFIKDRKFVVLNGNFVEYLYHSQRDIYVEYKCKLSQPGKPSGYGGTSKTTAIGTVSSLYSAGMAYELKLPEDYKAEPYRYYWIKKNGELLRFINMRELKKLYSSKEDLYKEYLKKYNVKYENQESIIQLIDYMEAN